MTRDNERHLFKKAFMVGLVSVLLIWAIKITELFLEVDFRHFGILPRTLKGSVGILAAPLIHSDWVHLFSNTFPLMMLLVAVVFFYSRIYLKLLIGIYFVTGILVWVFAREAVHLGASGIVYGLIGFLLISGLVRNDAQSLAISLAFLFLYGGVLQGIFPNAVNQHVSWESHLMGFLTGFVLALFFKKYRGPEDLIQTEDSQEDTNTDFTMDGPFNYTYKEED